MQYLGIEFSLKNQPRLDGSFIPFGVWGTEHVWPRVSPVPRMLNLTDPPRVRVRVGEPVELKGRSMAADTRRIMAAITDCLPARARERHEPTPEEIRLATPAR